MAYTQDYNNSSGPYSVRLSPSCPKWPPQQTIGPNAHFGRRKKTQRHGRRDL